VKLIMVFMFFVVFFVCGTAQEGNTAAPSGYERVSWGTNIDAVAKHYPRGQKGRLGDELFYRQFKPSNAIARRNFAFKDNRLHVVSVSYDRRYIERCGLERLLFEQRKLHGAGRLDTTMAPQMVSWVWVHADTKVTLSYVPKRPDITVMLYEYLGVSPHAVTMQPAPVRHE